MAMIIYAIATIPLILTIREIILDQPNSTSKLEPNTDDYTAAGTLTKSYLTNTLCDLKSLNTTHF